MNLLCLTGIYPTPAIPTSGHFVARRLVELRKSGVEVDAFYQYSNPTPVLGIARRIAQAQRGRDWRGDTIELDGIGFRPIPVSTGLGDVLNPREALDRAARQVEAAVDIGRYDLLHVHWACPEGAIGARIARRHGIPYVLTLHGSDIHTLPRNDPFVREQTIDALNAADRAIFVSRALLEAAQEIGYDGRGAVVIPNGVDTALFRPLPPDDVARITGRMPSTERVVGYVGGLSTVKRADALPEIFGRVHLKAPGTRFVVLGGGPLRDEIETETRRRNLDVAYPGIVPNDQVPAWMNLLDALVVPSRREGFGCVITEAHACGVPVVGSENGGIPEAVGEGGIIVPEGPDLEERFSDAVVEVLDGGYPCAALRRRALSFDWSVTVARERELYRELLAG
jgi:glycosyltransferase involved in cell wall biosynthesis